MSRIDSNKQIPSGKRLHNYGKSPFFKSTISMTIFNSYVKLPESNFRESIGFSPPIFQPENGQSGGWSPSNLAHLSYLGMREVILNFPISNFQFVLELPRISRISGKFFFKSLPSWNPDFHPVDGPKTWCHLWMPVNHAMTTSPWGQFDSSQVVNWVDGYPHWW